MYTQKEGRKENPVFPGAINAGGGVDLGGNGSGRQGSTENERA